MLQTDSITVNTEAGEDVVVHKHYQPTPAQILKWLPKTATPEQQDSAIQAHTKPCEIHWSNRPDTLHLPGQKAGKSILDVSIPQYYKETYFSNKPYFHSEIMGGRQGVAGDPVPYSIAGDSIMSSILILCLLITLISVSRSWQFIIRQLKSFFYIQRGNTTEVTETSTEVRFQFLLTIENCILLAIIYFFYMRENIIDTFTIGQYQIIAIFSGTFAGYFLFKQILYQIANWTFFDRKNIQQWNKAFLFLVASEGVFFLPLVLVQSFFHAAINSSLIYLVIVVVLFKLLTFYKSAQIFFAPKGQLLQNFLYFCTLELLPLSALWGILLIISEHLKINI